MAKKLTGTVVTTKQEKTVLVSVERAYRHKLYKKIIKRHKKFLVHNEGLELAPGDMVTIQETRPISKTKHFKVVEKLG